MSYYDSDARRTLKGMGFPPSFGARIDAGLRAHMQRVFGYIAGVLALTGLVAYAAAASGFYQDIAATPLIWLVMPAPLGFVLALELWDPAHGRRDGDAAVLALCRRHGTVAWRHLSGVYRRIDCACVLHYGGDLRRDESLRLYDQIQIVLALDRSS
jgi:hypothetical protein